MRLKIGSVVAVNHPITVLNPEKYFAIAKIEFDTAENKTWICGKDTCWFTTTAIVEVIQ